MASTAGTSPAASSYPRLYLQGVDGWAVAVNLLETRHQSSLVSELAETDSFDLTLMPPLSASDAEPIDLNAPSSSTAPMNVLQIPNATVTTVQLLKEFIVLRGLLTVPPLPRPLPLALTDLTTLVRPIEYAFITQSILQGEGLRPSTTQRLVQVWEAADFLRLSPLVELLGAFMALQVKNATLETMQLWSTPASSGSEIVTASSPTPSQGEAVPKDLLSPFEREALKELHKRL
jgi:hypothetical protein